MTPTRRRFASLIAFGLATAVSACGGDGLVIPEEARPTAIAIVSGDAQSAPAGAALGQALVVRVTDALNRPVEGQAVEFTIDVGSGQVTPASPQTGPDGQASASWTLGSAAGQQRVQAKVTGSDLPATLLVKFNASAFSGDGAVLELVSGDNQRAAVGSALPDSLVVRVTDAHGNPVAGVQVAWSVDGGGSISPATVATDAEGKAAAERVLGNSAGAQTAQASTAALTPVSFTHTADPANPTALVLISGEGQIAPAGFPVPDSLVVRLLDDNGNGVGGKVVAWVVPTGNGTATPSNSTTDPSGYAVTHWTLGPSAGSKLLNAVFSGLPSVPFTATATADVPTKLVLVSGNNQSGTVGTTLANPLRVRVTDASDNPVENVSVTWTANGGGSVSSSTSSTNVDGIAEVVRTLGITPGQGQYTTTAAVAGLAGSPVTFTASAIVGPPTVLVFTVQPTSSGVGQVITPAVEVAVLDAQGNLVSSATTLITVSSSILGTLSVLDQLPAVGGVATFSNLSIAQAGSGYTLRASASGLQDGRSDTFDVGKSGTSTAITGDSHDPSVVGEAVTVTFTVTPSSGGGSPTGLVTVSDGLGTSCLASVAAGGCVLTFTSAGDRTLTAAYAGDANFASSSSGGTSHQVKKAPTNLNLTDDAPEPSVFGQPVTFSFSVLPQSPGAGTPTDTVTVTGGGSSCSATVAQGSCSLTPTSVGAKNYAATYAGDDNFASDNSPSRAHTVVVATTSTTVLSSELQSDFGQAVTFTATVSAVSPGGGIPTGQVLFFDGASQIGSSHPLDAFGVAAVNVPGLLTGSHTITAQYAGTSTYNLSASAPITQTVSPVASDDAYEVNANGSLVVPANGVLANDQPGSGLTAVLVDGPSHGNMIQFNSDGSFTYEPNTDSVESDSFTYYATDGSLSSGTATVTITIAP